MFSELVATSLQVLANWIARTEADSALQRCRQFVVNKLPSLLSLVSGSSYGSFSSETSLVAAMTAIDGTIPSTDSRQFMRVCVLYHLMSSTALDTTEIPKEMQVRGLYQKDEITSQIKSNVQRVAKFIEEIPQLEGNSGAIAQALVEVRHLIDF